MVKQLLAGGADLEAKDNDGHTPIDIARRSRSWLNLAILERAAEIKGKEQAGHSDKIA